MDPETLTYKDLLAVMAQHEVAYQRHESVLTRQEELMAKHSDLLADVMKSIGQLFQRIPVSSPSPAPRPPPIGFLTQCSLTFELQPSSFPTDRSKIAYIITLLADKALSWASAVWESQDVCCGTYTLFVEEFKWVFDHPVSGRKSSRQLLTLKQGSRSTADFAIEFRTIASGSGWNDEALMACFQGGLSGPILDELVTCEPATDLESLITMAIRLDNRLRERVNPSQDVSAPIVWKQATLSCTLFLTQFWETRAPGGHAVGAFQTLPCREGSPHEGESLPILRCIWAFPSPLSRAPWKRPSPPSYRRAVMGKISAPPPNAVLSVPVTLSWEGHQHQVRAMIDSRAAGDFLDRSLVRRLGIPSQLLPRPQTVTALDGRPLEPGCITEITYPLRLTVFQHQHMEEFYLTPPSSLWSWVIPGCTNTTLASTG